MKPGITLLCSQDPNTGPCPEPDESSPCLIFSLLKIHFNVLSNLRLLLQNGVHFSDFSTKIFYAIIFLSIACYMLRQSPPLFVRPNST
jgi:hypothetical protein